MPISCCVEKVMDPPASLMRSEQMHSPRPVPLCSSGSLSLYFCVVKGSKILSCIFGGMPGPVSVISRCSVCACVCAVIVSLPLDFRIAFMALRQMLRMICCRFRGEMASCTSGNSSSSSTPSLCGSLPRQAMASSTVSASFATCCASDSLAKPSSDDEILAARSAPMSALSTAF